MSRSAATFRSAVSAAALAALFAAGSLPARAQVDTTKPIPVRTLKTKLETFKGTVVHVTPVAITVRSQENELVIRTFNYTDRVRDQIQQIIDRGGYQYGDKVEIKYETGSIVAQRIKG